MSSGSNGLRWGAISQQAGRVFSHGVLSKPPANTRPPSSPKFIRAHNIMACPPLVSHSSFYSWVCFTCDPSSSGWLDSPRNSDSGLWISPGPLEGPLLVKARRDPRHGAQKKGCQDRCFQQGLGSAVRGQTHLWPVVRRGVGAANQLPINASSVSGLSILHHVLIRSDSSSVVSYINHQGGLDS